MNKNGDKRKPTKQMVEAMILAKLYKDGLFVIDEKKKTAKVDLRQGTIVKRYKEESYDDIKDIMQRTVKGLKMQGYTVKVRWLDGLSVNYDEKLEEIEDIIKDTLNMKKDEPK